MMDFIYKLYDYDNFTLYLTIILVVLIVLFVLVLIFGKKDKALEETRRLQKIELEESKKAFKEEEKEPVKLETPKEKTPLFDFVDEEESKLIEPKEVNMTIYSPEAGKNIPKASEEDDIILPLVEEEKEDFSFSDLDEITADLAKDLENLKSIKDEFSNISIPEEINDKKEKEESKSEAKVFQPSGVFSSVFVGKDTDTKEIPTVTVPVKEENKKIAEDEEDDFELPLLK